MKKRNLKKTITVLVVCAVVGVVLCGIFGVSVNIYVRNLVSERILSAEESFDLDADCILVLGSGVLPGGVPGKVLTDRLDKSLFLYENGTSEKLLMSGDHGRESYDEVNVMKDYALDKNIPSNDIFMDHAGFSTYESMYRAKTIFKAKRIIIVTQEYHLYRSMYIADKLGLEAYGVAAIENNYAGQYYRDAREFLARNKDFVKVIFKPKPTYLGEEIPISGNGNITNDK